MGRLTQMDDQGNWSLKGVRWEQLYTGQVITEDVSERLYAALAKLREYEDTGLSLEAVEMKELNEEQQKNRWIPVGERLPGEDTEVLAYIKHNYADDGWRAYRVYEYSGGRWLGMGNLCEVIAWMPLPEPYGGNKNESK